jgi:uncharacterized protein
VRKTTSRSPVAPGVLLACLALFAAAAAWLLLTGQGVRTSADHAATRPLWQVLAPVLAGLLLVRLLPPRRTPEIDGPVGRAPAAQALALLASAALFAVTLRLSGGGDTAFLVLKAVFLLAVPLAVFWAARGRPAAAPTAAGGAWRHAGAAVAVAGWFALAYLSPIGAPRSDLADTTDTITLIMVLVAGFAVNALLEEVFYRRWLQTRLESVLGRWPAVLLSSLLFGVWHVGIMGGPLAESLAGSIVYQGALGVLLGYLWSRYRLMWPILTAHGALNAAPILLGMM